MNRLQELRDLLTTFEKDFVKFYEKGNKSAGTRVRKHMNELKRKAQEIRKEVQDIQAVDKTGEPAAPDQQSRVEAEKQRTHLAVGSLFRLVR